MCAGSSGIRLGVPPRGGPKPVSNVEKEAEKQALGLVTPGSASAVLVRKGFVVDLSVRQERSPHVGNVDFEPG